jgi:hypothetical protein
MKLWKWILNFNGSHKGWRCHESRTFAKESSRHWVEPTQEKGHMYCKHQGYRYGTSMSIGVHIRIPHAQDAECGTTGCNVCLASIWSCFNFIFSCYFLIFFGMGMLTAGHFILWIRKLFLVFRGSHISICSSLGRGCELDFWTMTELLRLWKHLEMD